MSKSVRTYCSVQTRTRVSCQDDIFVKDVADSRTRQSLMVRVVEKRQLIKETQFGVEWINEVAKQIAEKTA